MKRIICPILAILLLFIFFPPKAHATFSYVSDTITNPSPSATVSAKAMHTVKFTTTVTIPASGKVVITFPKPGNSTTIPSATSFAFNNLSSSNIKTDGITCGSWTISAPSITCVTTSSVAVGTTITFLIGCSTNSGATCTTQAPTLINPTKKNTTQGAADIWRIKIQSKDSSNIVLEESSAKIATVELVNIGTPPIATVTAVIEPMLIFTITGINKGLYVNSGNTTGCTNGETTSLASSATLVDLGFLNDTPTLINTKVGNIAAQLLTVSINTSDGYALTATSSGKLINSANMFAINSSKTPASFPKGKPWFGIHPCGRDVNGSTWTEANNQNCSTVIDGSSLNECRYGWPESTASLALSSDSSGPIGDSVFAGNGLTSVEYAAGIDESVPAGTYSTTINYLVTPTF